MFEHCQDMIDTDSGVIPRRLPVCIVKPKVKPPRVYANSEAHPEFQSLQMEAGFRSVLMKQLEINERLLREILAELKRG